MLFNLYGCILLSTHTIGYPTAFILGYGCGNKVLSLISHSILYFAVRVGNGVFAIATLAFFTRLLSQEEYGMYALCMAEATFASGVLFQWLNVAISRFYPHHLQKF